MTLQLYVAVLVVSVILVKALIWKIMDETDAKALWRDSLLLFLVYALAMCASLYAACADAPSVEICVQRMLVTFLIGTILVLIPCIICYFVKQKRGLSQMDRMKLQDM